MSKLKTPISMIDLIVDLTRDPETNMLRLRRLLRPFIFIQVRGKSAIEEYYRYLSFSTETVLINNILVLFNDEKTSKVCNPDNS